MAKYYDAAEVSRMLRQQLEPYRWENAEDGQGYTIELPVVLYFNYQRLFLRILPLDDGYCISDDGNTFAELSQSPAHYISLFDAQDKHYHFHIREHNGFVFKQYGFDFALMAALDQFVRFFVYLDDFMLEKEIV